MYKFLLTITCLFIISTSHAATCSETTRPNYSAGQVLTSSALNADFNQLVAKSNAIPGGCITDSTITSTAFDSSLDAVKNGIMQGCAFNYVDSNTVQVDKCIISLNGKFVKTTAATNVTWGCSSCASEVVSTQYWVYASITSSGSTLNLLISNTSPDAAGFDGSGNKVIGKFYNDSSSNIDPKKLYKWDVDRFISVTAVDKFSFEYGGDSSGTICTTGTCYLDQLESFVTLVTHFGTGAYDVSLVKSYSHLKCTVSPVSSSPSTTPAYSTPIVATSNVSFITYNGNTTLSPGTMDTWGTVYCEGY